MKPTRGSSTTGKKSTEVASWRSQILKVCAERGRYYKKYLHFGKAVIKSSGIILKELKST